MGYRSPVRHPKEAFVEPIRRVAILAAGLAVAAAASPPPNFISAPDVVVYCDTALAAALGMVGADFRARTGVPVRVFSQPAIGQLALIERGTRSDVVVIPVAQMDDAARGGLVKPDTRAGAWRNPVVLAARDAPASARPVDAAGLPGLLGGGRLAVIEPLAADRMDGPGALARLGWADALAGRVDGMATGQEVAFSVANGSSVLGLLHRSDLAVHRNLHVVGTADPKIAPPAEYSAALSKNILSRHASAFLDYLNGPEATQRLAGLGVEKMQ